MKLNLRFSHLPFYTASFLSTLALFLFFSTIIINQPSKVARTPQVLVGEVAQAGVVPPFDPNLPLNTIDMIYKEDLKTTYYRITQKNNEGNYMWLLHYESGSRIIADSRVTLKEWSDNNIDWKGIEPFNVDASLDTLAMVYKEDGKTYYRITQGTFMWLLIYPGSGSKIIADSRVTLTEWSNNNIIWGAVPPFNSSISLDSLGMVYKE